MATHLLGSHFVPPLKGAVLVLEDVGESPYRIDRMPVSYTHLTLPTTVIV